MIRRSLSTLFAGARAQRILSFMFGGAWAYGEANKLMRQAEEDRLEALAEDRGKS